MTSAQPQPGEGPAGSPRNPEHVTPSRPAPGTYLRAIERIPRALGALIWSVAGLVVALSIGRFCLVSWSDPRNAPVPSSVPETSIVVHRKAQLDRAVALAFEKARADALAYGDQQLRLWLSEVKGRIDPFLDEQFSYITQQLLGLRGLWYTGRHWIDSSQPAAGDALRTLITAKLATQVVQPEVANLRVHRITREAVELYVTRVQQYVGEIPAKLNVPAIEWDRYVSDLGAVGSRVEANLAVPLSLKLILTTSASSVVFLTARAITISVEVGTAVMPKIVTVVLSRPATTTGVRVLAGVGGRMVGLVVGLGVLAWDITDHRRTVSVQRPILKANIEQYLDQLKVELLRGPTGIAGVLDELERQLVPAQPFSIPTT